MFVCLHDYPPPDLGCTAFSYLARAVDRAADTKIRGVAKLGAGDFSVVARQCVRASAGPNIPYFESEKGHETNEGGETTSIFIFYSFITFTQRSQNFSAG